MGKVKWLELWWQLYRTSLPVWDLENYRPMDFCWHECTWGLHAGYLRLQTHTQNMWYLLLSHCYNGCTNVPQCYVTRASPGLFWQSPFTTHQSSAAIMWLYLSGLWHTGMLPSTFADSYTMHHSVLNNHTTMPPFVAAIFSPVTSSASAFILIHIKHNLITPTVVDTSKYTMQPTWWWHKQNPTLAKRCSWLYKLTSIACYATMSWHIPD